MLSWLRLRSVRGGTSRLLNVRGLSKVLVYQGSFERSGPLIPLMVYNPRTGNGLSVLGLLDTGADGLCVSCHTVEQLGLVLTGQAPINIAAGPTKQVPTIEATFELLDTKTSAACRFENTEATVAALGPAHGMPFHVVLGWPVVSQGRLVTEAGQFTFSIAPNVPALRFEA